MFFFGRGKLQGGRAALALWAPSKTLKTSLLGLFFGRNRPIWPLGSPISKRGLVEMGTFFVQSGSPLLRSKKHERWILQNQNRVYRQSGTVPKVQDNSKRC